MSHGPFAGHGRGLLVELKRSHLPIAVVQKYELQPYAFKYD